jgi:hypothetical protein
MLKFDGGTFAGASVFLCDGAEDEARCHRAEYA